MYLTECHNVNVNVNVNFVTMKEGIYIHSLIGLQISIGRASFLG